MPPVPPIIASRPPVSSAPPYPPIYWPSYWPLFFLIQAQLQSSSPQPLAGQIFICFALLPSIAFILQTPSFQLHPAICLCYSITQPTEVGGDLCFPSSSLLWGHSSWSSCMPSSSPHPFWEHSIQAPFPVVHWETGSKQKEKKNNICQFLRLNALTALPF